MSEQVQQSSARVGIVMGSDSDWPVMQDAGEVLTELGVAWEADVVSAHRMPTEMVAWGQQAHTRGLSVVIAGAGGAAHLPGILASRILGTSDPDLQQRLVAYQDSLAEAAHAKGEVVRQAAAGAERRLG